MTMFLLELPDIDNSSGRRLTTLDLERFTNDGSPSGYTFKHSSSIVTTAWRGLPDYPLPIVHGKQTWQLGNRSLLPTLGIHPSEECPVHPDCLFRTSSHMKWNGSAWRNISVVPTSSPRVVLALPHAAISLKLHYPSKLGRFARPLLGEQLRFGVEISSHVCSLNLEFSDFLPELFAAEYKIEGSGQFENVSDFGILLRQASPANDVELSWVVPCFSLLARKNFGLLRRPLVADVAEWLGTSPAVFFSEYFIPTLCRSIAEIVTTAGVWPELTAQNFFFAVSKDGKPKIIWRDFQGFFVDHKLLNLSHYSGRLADFKYHAIYVDHPEWRSYLVDDVFHHHIVKPMLRMFRSKQDHEAIERSLHRNFQSTGLFKLLPEVAFAMNKNLPKPGVRLSLMPSPKPSWRN